MARNRYAAPNARVAYPGEALEFPASVRFVRLMAIAGNVAWAVSGVFLLVVERHAANVLAVALFLYLLLIERAEAILPLAILVVPALLNLAASVLIRKPRYL